MNEPSMQRLHSCKYLSVLVLDLTRFALCSDVRVLILSDTKIEQNQLSIAYSSNCSMCFAWLFLAFSNEEDSEYEEDDGAGHQSYVDDNSVNGPALSLGRSIKST